MCRRPEMASMLPCGVADGLRLPNPAPPFRRLVSMLVVGEIASVRHRRDSKFEVPHHPTQAC